MKVVIRPVFALENSDLVAENDEELVIQVKEAIARSPTNECIVQKNKDGIFFKAQSYL